MSQFENVTVLKKANVYFDGKVTSRTVLFADGTKKTLGIMLPGEYEFGTDAKKSWKSSLATSKCCCQATPSGSASPAKANSRFPPTRNSSFRSLQ